MKISVAFSFASDWLIIWREIFKPMTLRVVMKNQPMGAHTGGAYPALSNMKQLGVLLLFPGGDASPWMGYPKQYVVGTQLNTWPQLLKRWIALSAG